MSRSNSRSENFVPFNSAGSVSWPVILYEIAGTWVPTLRAGHHVGTIRGHAVALSHPSSEDLGGRRESGSAHHEPASLWWYKQVKKGQLSGGDFISNWHDDKPGEATYEFRTPRVGQYEFWVRPIRSTHHSYQLSAGPWKEIELGSPQDSINVAADNKIAYGQITGTPPKSIEDLRLQVVRQVNLGRART